MTNHNKTINLESIDIILQNLRKDPEHYNHGSTHEQYMQEEQRV